MSVDVHCGTYVSVSEQFLHIFWCCSVGEQITGECVSQYMKMEIFKSFQFLFCRPCHNTKVFDKNSVYLPTKKIGKNNPKAAEIEADNTARQEWNRTADLALVSGIEEAKILEIKQTEIHDKAGQSIRENGWLPNLFRGIVGKAKEFLQAIIREKNMPPKPVLNVDMDEFRTMQSLMLKVQKQAKAIKKIQEVTLPNLRQQLAETTGIFKGKERKALEKQIQQTEAELAEKWINSPIFSPTTVILMYRHL